MKIYVRYSTVDEDGHVHPPPYNAVHHTRQTKSTVGQVGFIERRPRKKKQNQTTLLLRTATPLHEALTILSTWETVEESENISPTQNTCATHDSKG